MRSNTSQEIIDLTEESIIPILPNTYLGQDQIKKVLSENSFNETSVESKIENITKSDANDAAADDDDEESLEDSFREEGILLKY